MYIQTLNECLPYGMKKTRVMIDWDRLEAVVQSEGCSYVAEANQIQLVIHSKGLSEGTINL